MAVLKLSVEQDYDFILIGIAGNIPDYRLCLFLNNRLSLNLAKVNDFSLQADRSRKISNPDLFEKNTHSLFSHFCFEDEDNYRSYHVVSNIGTASVLVPEHRKVNYLMLLKGPFGKADKKELLEKINAIEFVASAYEINVEELGSKKNLPDIFHY